MLDLKVKQVSKSNLLKSCVAQYWFKHSGWWWAANFLHQYCIFQVGSTWTNNTWTLDKYPGGIIFPTLSSLCYVCYVSELLAWLETMNCEMSIDVSSFFNGLFLFTIMFKPCVIFFLVNISTEYETVTRRSNPIGNTTYPC